MLRLKYKAEKDPFAFKVCSVAILLLLLTGLIALGAHAVNRLTPQTSDISTTGTSQQREGGSGKWYTVVEVIDGDTIIVSVDGLEKSVRLIGIDTPETKDPNTSVQCYGPEATIRMQELIENKRVQLVADTSQDDLDKYNRMLRYVFLENNGNVALEMIRGGYGKEYTYSAPYKYQSEFQNAEQEAKSSGSGLWSASTCGGEVTEASAGTAPSSNQQSASPDNPVASDSNCDSNYSPCVQISSTDLDCRHIPYPVTVIGQDIHGFDREGDGRGCENN